MKGRLSTSLPYLKHCLPNQALAVFSLFSILGIEETRGLPGCRIRRYASEPTGERYRGPGDMEVRSRM
jgi:hypothetical protein